MFGNKLTSIIIILMFVFFKWIQTGTDVIVERVFVDHVNEKYVRNVTAIVRRYSRRSPYLVNVDGTILQTIGPNVTIDVFFYEFLHNEYKRSFVEFHAKVCDMFYKDPYKRLIGARLLDAGLSCPIAPGVYKIHNVTGTMRDFPYVWPFEKLMIEWQAQIDATREIVSRARVYAIFKRRLS